MAALGCLCQSWRILSRWNPRSCRFRFWSAYGRKRTLDWYAAWVYSTNNPPFVNNNIYKLAASGMFLLSSLMLLEKFFQKHSVFRKPNLNLHDAYFDMLPFLVSVLASYIHYNQRRVFLITCEQDLKSQNLYQYQSTAYGIANQQYRTLHIIFNIFWV